MTRSRNLTAQPRDHGKSQINEVVGLVGTMLAILLGSGAVALEGVAVALHLHTIFGTWKKGTKDRETVKNFITKLVEQNQRMTPSEIIDLAVKVYTEAFTKGIITRDYFTSAIEGLKKHRKEIINMIREIHNELLHGRVTTEESFDPSTHTLHAALASKLRQRGYTLAESQQLSFLVIERNLSPREAVHTLRKFSNL
jgi:ATP-dependent exoDNAse (exonuclease V) alpha subunit